MGTIIVRDKIYVPSEDINQEEVTKRFVHKIYQENNCAKCPNLPFRHNFECDRCPAFSSITTASTKLIKNREYIGLPIGCRDQIESWFKISYDDYRIVDLRVKKKFEYDIVLSDDLKLRDYQIAPVDKFVSKKHGSIISPPRSGKTIMMLKCIMELGYRALVLAHQKDFLDQFLAQLETHTNLPELEKQHGKKLYGYPKKIEDFDTIQIGVCTYQQFSSKTNGDKRFKRAAKNFGCIFIDELHKVAANVFASIVNSFPTYIKGGVTATPKRKDCFTSDTPVVLDHAGTTKPISEVLVGETVLSKNQSTGMLEEQPVIATYTKYSSTELLRITHEHGTFTCTPDHEIWSHTRQAYVKACELTEFDSLCCDSAGDLRSRVRRE